MKNSTKVILLVSICFLIIGSMLSVIGIVILGGSPAFSLTGKGLDIERSGKEYKLDKTKLGKISSIDMDVDFADVTFIESDDFYIEYDYLGENKPFYEVNNGKLVFKDNKEHVKFNLNFGFTLPGNNHDYGVKIYLPANAQLDKVDINQSGGDITIGGFQASELTAVNSFGDVELKGIDAKTSDIKLSSGNLEINGMDSGDSTIDNSFGDITVTDFNRNNKYPDASGEITISSGSLDVDCLTAASLTINNSFGDIDMSDVTVGELICELSSGSATVDKGTFNNAYFNNDFGDVNLELVGKESDYALELDTDFGDIDVMGNDEGDSYDNHNAAAHTISVSADSGDVGIDFTAKGSN